MIGIQNSATKSYEQDEINLQESFKTKKKHIKYLGIALAE